MRAAPTPTATAETVRGREPSDAGVDAWFHRRCALRPTATHIPHRRKWQTFLGKSTSFRLKKNRTSNRRESPVQKSVGFVFRRFNVNKHINGDEHAYKL